MRHLMLAPAALVVFVSGCPDRTISVVPTVPGKVETLDFPANPRRDIDILFVIDNSQSMKEEQDSLRANFSRFMSVLETLDGGMPDVHIGVATSDLGTSATDGSVAPAFGGCATRGDDGGMRTAPSITGRFIADDGRGNKNYSGTLEDAFSAIADVGIAGCGIEQHLGSMQRALDNPANTGFLRPDAYLGVIVIGDEDDCSLAKSSLFQTSTNGYAVNFMCTKDGVECDDTPDDMTTPGERTRCHPSTHAKYVESVDRYASFLLGLKPDARQIVTAGILGDTHPFVIENDTTHGTPVIGASCTYTSASGTAQIAYPAVRTADFLGQFEQHTQSTICDGDLSHAMTEIGAVLRSAVEHDCFLSPPVDADPSTPEPDYDCTVSDTRRVDGVDQEVALIPRCETGKLPCWRIEDDGASCFFTKVLPHLKLVVDRGGAAPDPAIHVKASCVTEDLGGGSQQF